MARASASEIRWDIDGKSNCVRLTFVVEVSAIAQNNGAFNHQSQGEGEILRTSIWADPPKTHRSPRLSA
jgi:hypothetical protein